MLSSNESEPEKKLNREPFTTIDDLCEMAKELVDGLNKLGNRQHPLGVRRGIREGVEIVTKPNENSMMVKAGSKTYFFDIKETREAKPYLVITESRLVGEGEDRERKTIVVFPESAQEFADAVAKMVTKLS